MTGSILKPATVDELVEAVLSWPRVIATGGLTKARLSTVCDDTTTISMTALRGITEYEPDEFTFTALTGTPLREIVSTLEEKRQHMPFDPMLVDAGGTLGGMVASGLSGPGRLRFGGVRDFILGVRFVDGSGRVLRTGGKVVKNAAGFDVPKFFVGSLGRFGVLAEITFKVFPRPESTLTLELPAATNADAIRMLEEIPASRWEPRALEFDPHAGLMHVQLGGPQAALDAIAAEILERWPGRRMSEDDAHVFWSGLREFAWTHPEGSLLKLVFNPRMILELDSLGGLAPGARFRISAAGDVAFASVSHGADWNAIDRALTALDVAALTLRGEAPLWPGLHSHSQISDDVKRAMDPADRFPGLND